MSKIKQLVQFPRIGTFKIISLLSSKIFSLCGNKSRKEFTSVEELVDDHFLNYSYENHPCRQSLLTALDMLRNKPANIIETGSSAWGTNSSLLFDSYVNSFGGSFCSVDIRMKPMLSVIGLCTKKTTFYCDDSINFLKAIPKNNISMVYLDSSDVNWQDPIQSAIHGFNEFLVILPYLLPGALLLIDDTPKDMDVMSKVHPEYLNLFELFQKKYGFSPGKGGLVLDYLQKYSTGSLIEHDYQLLWRF